MKHSYQYSLQTFERPEELGLEPKQNIYVSKVASDNAARYICVGKCDKI